MEMDDLLNAQAAGRSYLVQYEVPEQDAKNILSLYLIAEDLLEMVNCIDLAASFGLPNKTNTLMITALWEKMMFMYGKLFASSKDGYSSLNDGFFRSTDMLLHQELIALRNSYLAHRGDNALQHHKLILSVESDEENCKVKFIVPDIQLKGHFGNPVQIRRY